MGTQQKGRFNKATMILYFLQGSVHFFVISILSAFGVTLLEMLVPQLIRFTVDSVIGSAEPDLPSFMTQMLLSMGGVSYLRAHLHVIAILIIVLALFAAVCKYLFNLYNNKGAETLMQTMRNRLFAHIQRLPFAWHMKHQTGDIIQRCTSDVERVKIFVAEQLTSIVRIVILVSLSLFFMYSMNVKLALIATACIPVILGYSAYFHSKIGSHFQECDENEGILSTIAQENLTGVRVVRAFGRENYERERFEKQNQHYTSLWVKLCKLMAFFWGSGDLISGLQVILVLAIG